MFKGRKLLIVTKHEKEKVIAPIVELELGVDCFVTNLFDTDKLGTFSGEIEREDEPIATVRKKCISAMEMTGADLAIANEGSFGPHPSFYFIPADDEFMIFIDKKNELEIIVRELSTDTNYNASAVKNEKELFEFAEKAKFPTHGLILKNKREHFTTIVKGITSEQELLENYNKLLSQNAEVYIETDMRAMYNPSRMKIIESATKKLVAKIKAACPKCNTPGFGIKNAKEGLRCELCNSPTRSTLSYVYACKKCLFEQEEKFPNGKMKEDPTYCDVCNP
jgi:hypothetical protein